MRRKLYAWKPDCFFFNDTATTEIYTLSLHDALPISRALCRCSSACARSWKTYASAGRIDCTGSTDSGRSEEHTSELQSRLHLVCRLLLEKKKLCRRQKTREASTAKDATERNRLLSRP